MNWVRLLLPRLNHFDSLTTHLNGCFQIINHVHAFLRSDANYFHLSKKKKEMFKLRSLKACKANKHTFLRTQKKT